jgi:hypothetical protein
MQLGDTLHKMFVVYVRVDQAALKLSCLRRPKSHNTYSALCCTLLHGFHCLAWLGLVGLCWCEDQWAAVCASNTVEQNRSIVVRLKEPEVSRRF